MVRPGEEGLALLGQALDAALLALALSIVRGRQGSTRTMKLTVTGASDEKKAEAVARAVANSPLVKTTARPRRQLGPHHAGHRAGAWP